MITSHHCQKVLMYLNKEKSNGVNDEEKSDDKDDEK
jgi:hypothetical protein